MTITVTRRVGSRTGDDVAVSVPPAPVAERIAAAMRRPALLGRDAELETLDAALLAAAGDSVALVLRGEPGIGKTALLGAAAARARELGYRVLTSTAMESGSDLPYAGLHDLLHPLLGAVGILPPQQRRALLSAFGLETDPAPQSLFIALAARGLLSAVAAQQPIMMAVDDIQWLDRETQDALAFLTRRLDGEPVLIVGAIRRGHDTVLAAAAHRTVEVPALDERAARELLRRHSDELDGPACERILEHARGNPLALVELPAAWRALEPGEGSPALSLSGRLERAFGARLRALPPATRDALLITALDTDNTVGQTCDAAAALAAAPVTISALQPAISAGLIACDGARLEFRHPLVRCCVLQAEPLWRRQLAHGALAQVLRTDPDRRVWHRAQATIGLDDRAADELERYAGRSTRRVAAAVRALERSAQLTTDPEARGRRLLLAAEHAFTLGRAEVVQRLVAAAAKNPLAELERAKMAWLREIFDDGVPGDATRVHQLCGTSEQAAATADVDLALNLLHGAALRCWWARTAPDAPAHVVRTLRTVAPRPDDPRAVAALAVADPVASGPAVSATLSRVVLETVTEPDALRLLGQAAHTIGDPARAVTFLERAETRLREQHRLGLLPHAVGMMLRDLIELGDWPRAEASMAEALQVSLESRQPIWHMNVRIAQGILAGLRGDATTAHAAAAEVELAAGGRGLNALLACVQLARGAAHLGQAQYDEAYGALRRLFDPDDAAFHPMERFRGVAYLAEAAARSGRIADLGPILDDLAEVAGRSASTTLQRQLSYARAVTAEAGAAERFERALAGDLTRWPWHRARLQLAYGTWLRRQRRDAESREPLRRALVVLNAIGAASWAGQARAELRAAGERGPREERPAPRDLLSPRELQIAEFVAGGFSNRQIAERLYLSPRTVGSHIYRIFPKLDITSRSQLAARMYGR